MLISVIVRFDCCNRFLCWIPISDITISASIVLGFSSFTWLLLSPRTCTRSFLYMQASGWPLLAFRFTGRSLGLTNGAIVHLHGVGGFTVAWLRRDLGIVSSLFPQVVILEIGTNDLDRLRPELVGSQMEELVRLLHDNFLVLFIGTCEMLHRVNAPFVNGAASIPLSLWRVEPIPYVFCWSHRGFNNPSVHPYLPDMVHVNSFRQYCLYRSYRGAIWMALTMLPS